MIEKMEKKKKKRKKKKFGNWNKTKKNLINDWFRGNSSFRTKPPSPYPKSPSPATSPTSSQCQGGREGERTGEMLTSSFLFSLGSKKKIKIRKLVVFVELS